ncbi:MAG: type II CRISPR RNA-guided endonuclease Cas9, partial [Firmicutes bacterium HGW-Firmicutes-13]
FTDKDYHKTFPTIYHLRKALISGDEKFDVRLVYLALHNILKHRGHFLFEGQEMENISKFSEVFFQMQRTLNEELEIDLACTSLPEVEEILSSRRMSRTEKKKRLYSLFSCEDKTPESKQKQVFINLFIGSPVQLAVLFPDESFEDSENLKIDFSSSRFEEEYDLLTNILEDKIVCIDHLKLIYDWALLADIRKGFRFLSEGKVEIYEKHKHDLRILKNLVKKFAPGSYKQFFADASRNGNYASFIGMTKKNNKKVPVAKRCKTEDFYKQINALFKNQKIEHEDFVYMQSEIESGTFMPRQVSKENSVIPYQMHLEELREILKNAGKYLKFLENLDDEGVSLSQKIEQLMKFRIPYYVGPLNDAHKDKGGNCWIVKRTPDQIRPWNFSKVVDIEKTAEGFITRMTNKCTYLVGADVLPKNSLLYSEYMVLNELNNLRINGEPITVKLKQQIFNELFKKIKKVTQKKLKSYLINEGHIEKTDEISGIDGDFKASLTSLIDFQEILPKKIENLEMIENLIRWIVLFGEDKKILKKRIEDY